MANAGEDIEDAGPGRHDEGKCPGIMEPEARDKVVEAERESKAIISQWLSQKLEEGSSRSEDQKGEERAQGGKGVPARPQPVAQGRNGTEAATQY